MSSRHSLVVAATLTLACGSAPAADAPIDGLVYNTKEVSSLVYHCEKSAGELECDFVQMRVGRKAKPEELDAKLKKARDDFRKNPEDPGPQCKAYAEILDILEGRNKAPKPEGLLEVSDVQRKDILEIGKAMMVYCSSRTEENYLKLIRLSHSREVRSCSVSSFTFKQSFKWVQGMDSQSGSWVTKGAPDGPCGIVQLSRFENEPQKGFSFGFWKYFARKAITNPSAEAFPGMACKNFDEVEYLYDWRSKEHSLRCDYIEFSPL